MNDYAELAENLERLGNEIETVLTSSPAADESDVAELLEEAQANVAAARKLADARC